MSSPDLIDDQPVSRLVAIITGSLAVAEFVAKIRALEAEHGPDLLVTNGPGRYEIRTPGVICGCRTCDAADRAVISTATGHATFQSVMIVCPECGNKRCPRATHHAHPCGNSNEPGQPGSAYA